MEKDYLAHISEDKQCVQLLKTHLENVANLSEKFSEFFAPQLSKQIGCLHDIGKYSDEFQKRICGCNITTDHSTAGGQYLLGLGANACNIIAAYCIMGHHTGLPNGGSTSDNVDMPTLSARKQRVCADFGAWSNDNITLPTQLAYPNNCSMPASNFENTVLIRMLFSSLIDADRLDTESFMQSGAVCRGNNISIDTLWNTFFERIKGFINPDISAKEINKVRSKILNDCLSGASGDNNIFSLTAPTGSGKTVSSLAFALKHAALKKKSRIIYVVPYNTIIEQNAKVFEDLLGEENVLQHHCNIDYKDDENDNNYKKRLATDNWDYPLIVTSSVQFFESLFSASTGKCRKLHNIVNSVIVFDEAQMIPQSYLLPCAAMIRTLADRFGCSVLLATATQVDLSKYLCKKPRELVENIEEVFGRFKRATISFEQKPITEGELVGRLKNHNQVLCIVNTKLKAQELFTELQGEEGLFHLSTTMFPLHRTDTLVKIRERLRNGQKCIVISTSLIEAGVDIDFECVYREESGLDSIVQSAGRCNRENKRDVAKSVVTVFKLQGAHPPKFILPNIGALSQIKKSGMDCLSPHIITEYFTQLFYNMGDEALDKKRICERINAAKMSFMYPFRDIAEEFRIIEENTKTIYILAHRADLRERINNGERSRELFRELGKYSVSLYDYIYKKLLDNKQIKDIDDEISLLHDGVYNENIGIMLIDATTVNAVV